MAGPKLASYRGLTAIVTGASSGIGRLLARRLAGEGARVALVARRARELDALAAEIRDGGGEAIPLPCDVSDRAAVAAACGAVHERWGTVDLLVNNAGYGRHGPFVAHDVDDIERMTRVNYLGAVYFTKAVLPRMIERGRGFVVFVASVAGGIGTPDEAAYSATKFALVGLAEGLSIELEDAGIHVLTVCPGVIDTPFFDTEMLSRLPPAARKRFVAPEGLVDAVLRALARGRHRLTYPGSLAAAYVARALAPGFFRRQVKRHTVDAAVGTKTDT